MMNRKVFLKKFEDAVEKYGNFDKYVGAGLKRKIQRMIFNPRIYVLYILWHLNLLPSKNKKTKLFWGREINLDIASKDSFILYNLGRIIGPGEDKLVKFLIKNLREDDVFYDIGANYGFYTYLSLEFCGEVHAFEPLPNVFENLKSNLSDFPNVFLNNLALSDTAGSSLLYIPQSHLGGSTIIQESLASHYYKFRQNPIEVKTINLAEYLKAHNPPSVIKMDVEGAEGLVIEGGREFFKNNSPIIAMEVWSQEEGGRISMQAVEKLRNLGYKSYFINFGGELEEAGGDLAEMASKNNLPADNFVFKKL